MNNQIHHVLRFGIALVALLALATTAPMRAQQHPPQPEATASQPIEHLLTPDGTLRLDSTVRGVFDARGWELLMDQEGNPRFIRQNQRQNQSHAESPQLAAAPGDERWSDPFGNPSVDLVQVFAVAVAGQDVYVGGRFSRAGNQPARNIARWNANSKTWSALGEGTTGPVLAIAILGNEIVAAGAFDSAGTIAANNIARWSNGAWKRLGAGEANGIGTPFFDEVRALATSGQSLYVGGYFFQAGGKDANSIARWNSASDAWNTLGDDPITNGVQGSVNSLLVSGEQLYVAGSIGAAGEVLVNNLAAWNITTSAWDSLGAGTDGEVTALALNAGKLYAGGYFLQAGNADARGLAVWDLGTKQWGPIGGNDNNSPDGNITAVAHLGGTLYVAGDFQNVGTTAATGIARWNGSAWSNVAGGLDGTPTALATEGANLYAVGQFVTAGASDARYLAQWNGTAWAGPGASLNGGAGTVQAVAVDGDDVYIGGRFLTAGDVSARNIVRWNKSTATWTSLGTGANNGTDRQVTAIAVGNDGNIYVGGNFLKAGATQATHLARWNKASGEWGALAAGIPGLVGNLAAVGNDLYVAGSFILPVGADTAVGVARWNGSAWSAPGGGIQKLFEQFTAEGMTTFAGNLYVTGGYATTEGTKYAVARFDGTTWTPLRQGIIEQIGVIAAAKDLLYTAVTMQALDDPATTVDRWNAQDGTWAQVGGELDTLNGTISALLVNNDGLFIGGTFSSRSDGTFPAVQSLARRNITGNFWEALGSGVNNEVATLTQGNKLMIVGGAFTQAGDKPARYLAAYSNADTTTEPPLSVDATEAARTLAVACHPTPTSGLTTISFSLPNPASVLLLVYDVTGQEVARLSGDAFPAGRNQQLWDASGLPAGTYYCRVIAGNISAGIRIVVEH